MPDDTQADAKRRGRQRILTFTAGVAVMPVAMALPPPTPCVPVPMPEPASPAKKPLEEREALRLAQITDEAIEAYNRILAKPHGLLPKATQAGILSHRANVKRCIATVRGICKDQFGNERIIPEFWQRYFTQARKDDFYSGHATGSRGHENYIPDFELLTRPKTMLRIYERAV